MKKDVNIYSFYDECYVSLLDFRKLQQENEILKENAKNNDKVVDIVNWENQLLKKENQELKEQNKKEFADYIKFKKEQHDEYLEKVNKLIKENQELKNQLEDMTLCRDIASGHRQEVQDREVILLTQQKKFINYLEDEIKDAEKIIKSLYKEIIGDKDE